MQVKLSPMISVLLTQDVKQNNIEIHLGHRVQSILGLAQQIRIDTKKKLFSYAHSTFDWFLKCLHLWPKPGHDAVVSITAEVRDRIAKVRNVDALSTFITDYLDE